VQQLRQFAEVFGGEDCEGVIEPVVTKGAGVFFHFEQNAFGTAGAGAT